MADLELSVGFDQSTIDKEIDKIDKKISKLTKSQQASSKILDKLESEYDRINESLRIETSLHQENTASVRAMKVELEDVSRQLSSEYALHDKIQEKLMQASKLRQQLYMNPAPAINALQQEATESQRLANETKKARKETEGINRELSKTEPKIKKATNSTKGLSSGLKGAAIGAKSIQAGFDKALKPMKSMLTRINGLIKRVLIFSIVAKALGVFRDYIGEAVASNDQLSNSLAVVKSNLYTAFAAVFSAVLPALQSLIDWLGKATAYVASFLAALFGSSYKAAQQTAKSFKKQTVATKKLAKETKKANKELDKQLAGFDELNVLSKEVSDDLNDIGGGGDADISTPGIQEPNMPDYSKQTAAAEAFAKRIREIFAGAGTYFQPITDALIRLKDRMIPFREPMMQGLKYTYDNTLVPFANWCTQEFIPQYLNTLGAEFSYIGTVLTVLEPAWEYLNEKVLKPFASELGEDVITILNFIERNFDKMSEQVQEDGPMINETIQNFIDIFVLARDTIKPIFDWFKKRYEENADTAIDTFLDINHDLLEILNGISTFLLGIFTGDWDKAWEGLKKIIEGAGDLIIDAVMDIIGGILKLFGIDSTDFKDTLKDLLRFVLNDFAPKFEEAWVGMQNSIIGAENGIIDGTERMINSIIRGFNRLTDKLNGLIGTINNIPGVNIPSIGSVGEISLPRIPYLAQGAVIPPNKEFLAMLGDQKSGTNIEAPAKLIEEIVSRAMQNNGNQSEYTFVAQIDGREIFKETVKQNNMYRKRVGRNAFAVGGI